MSKLTLEQVEQTLWEQASDAIEERNVQLLHVIATRLQQCETIRSLEARVNEIERQVYGPK